MTILLEPLLLKLLIGSGQGVRLCFVGSQVVVDNVEIDKKLPNSDTVKQVSAGS